MLAALLLNIPKGYQHGRPKPARSSSSWNPDWWKKYGDKSVTEPTEYDYQEIIDELVKYDSLPVTVEQLPKYSEKLFIDPIFILVIQEFIWHKICLRKLDDEIAILLLTEG